MYKNDWHCLMRIFNEEGIKGLYSGFSINLVRTIPMVFIQYTMF